MTLREDSLSSRDFVRLSERVYQEVGIRLGPEKKTMLESRLRRRLRELSLDSCARYCEYFFDPATPPEEALHFIDAVTTNKTDFFREPAHFDFLMRSALPELARGAEGRPLLLWSAGCSSGEEPYTLAMLLSEYAETHPSFRFEILATDVSTAMLTRAATGIYPDEAVEPVSPALRRKYLMRSRDRQAGRVRIAPELRQRVRFMRLNLMDAEYGLPNRADAVFCRNVMIYFDRPTQERVLNRLSLCLVRTGYLFVGHSESLHDLDVPLLPVAPAVYRKSHA